MTTSRSRTASHVRCRLPARVRGVRRISCGRGKEDGVGLRDLVYGVYERRLTRTLAGAPGPRHVGVILDGNRRWARAAGAGDVSHGHRAGADHINDVLGWCED